MRAVRDGARLAVQFRTFAANLDDEEAIRARDSIDPSRTFRMALHQDSDMFYLEFPLARHMPRTTKDLSS
jgi:hypothetical protein